MFRVMTMKQYMQILLSVDIAVTLGCGAHSYKRVTGPATTNRVERSEPVSVQPVKRYSNGKVLDVNRLRVDWRASDECDMIDSKYGSTAAYAVFDNMMRALVKYNVNDIFQQGFEYKTTGGIGNFDRELFELVHWGAGRPFVRESTEDPKMLMALGKEIHDNACNDPESARK